MTWITRWFSGLFGPKALPTQWSYPDHDPAWQPSAVRRTFDGHDPLKAEAIFAREQRMAAQRRAKSQRTIALSRKIPGKKADVYVMPDKIVRVK